MRISRPSPNYTNVTAAGGDRYFQAIAGGHSVAIDIENHFENQAAAKPGGVGRDLWYFLRHSRKWWLAPIVIVMFLFGLLLVLAGTGAAPFIYTFF
jgi:hypothetical protein